MAETVYGTIEEGHVMSEKVQSLASTVYKEFEKMIQKYDEDVVKELMPLVVGILESLDLSYIEKQEIEVELELLRDDNEQLLTQYEREKQLRKASEQKYLEMEDAIEGDKKNMEDKVESMESIIRMLELKARNAADHVTRLEEKESEMKKEYNKLHERYTELFKTHMDYMERTKILMGTDKLAELTGNSPRIKGFQLPNLRPVSMILNTGETPSRGDNSPMGFDVTSPSSGKDSNVSIKSEMGDFESQDSNRLNSTGESKETSDKVQMTDIINVTDESTTTNTMATTPELDENSESYSNHLVNDSASSRKGPVKKTIYDELAVSSSDMIAEVDFGADITGREVNPGDYASSDDEKDEKESNVSDNFFGMGKELENLILENTELLATKNALNIVKDDLIAKVDELSGEQEILREEITSLQAVRGRLQLRISSLEEELKKTKEELEKKNQPASTEEEGDVPMAQRKRFTRVEMARVLMERNQYKERLMELQEAVRWTEMIRASREHPELTPKKKSSIWNFFSNLFSSSNKPKRPIAVATVKYNAPTTQVQPVGDPNKKSREKEKLGQKSKAYEFLQEEAISEKAKKEREKERREQYKAVRAHVKKDDGRMQAYGWSLPAKYTPSPREASSKNQIPVPVPVYCRPLTDQDNGVKIWCSAGVNLTGGRTRDGGSIVGTSSIFYSNPTEETPKPTDDVEQLDQELKDHDKNLKDQEQLSSFVWICTSTQTTSDISVIDANNPADILETFRVSSSHILCIASVPGALESDYPVAEEILKAEAPLLPKETVISSGTKDSSESPESSGIGGITFVQCSTGGNSRETSPSGSPSTGSKLETKADIETTADNLVDGADKDADNKEKSDDSEKEKSNSDPLGVSTESDQPTVFRATGSPPSSRNSSPTSPLRPGDHRGQDSGESKDGDSGISDDVQFSDMEKMSSALPSMWLGSQTGSLYVHSAVAQWRRCLHSIKLRDSILSIVHVKGRVMVALADGTVAIFHRTSDGQWDLENYHLLDLGRPHHSIRCMTVIANKHVWCGYKNRINIINPEDMTIEKSFDAHPRKESQVRQLAWVGDGVWVSIRLDSTLRLYHAYTHQHLQDVDIEPYVSKMLDRYRFKLKGTGRLGFSFVRITAVLISSNRLWIGTGNGVIVSVPLSESNKQQITTSAVGRPGGVVRVYNDVKTDSVTPGSFIPYCSMSQAQLSFHGHKDAVKFFVAVPENARESEADWLRSTGTERKGISAACDEKEDTSTKFSHEATPAPPTRTKLVLSGGEGYVDFRMGDGGEEEVPDPDEEEKKASLTGKYDRSHLIVWQITSPE
ncbi:C-Jun-amino-terminal kinase-interacting protein 4 isoform X10 [Patella vulgata]|uniref:C-Jun-amino-terminal kinase-interacting protein 4 isoform X10 n=1 Tax=Patella vulgata TaxID=6465 RepID=UPI002180670D|nr:C-Jun-amino-terminal kinase-interacting protein 4 isoform X10 [Patella vulgata]